MQFYRIGENTVQVEDVACGHSARIQINQGARLVYPRTSVLNHAVISATRVRTAGVSALPNVVCPG